MTSTNPPSPTNPTGAGSRYAPVAPLAGIDAVLALGHPFALVGIDEGGAVIHLECDLRSFRGITIKES